jgi:phosphatidylinositol kinase/protein kinase (PI-3  family)
LVCLPVYLGQIYQLAIRPTHIVISHHCFRVALETIDKLTDTLDLSDYSSRIIHPLVRTLDTCSELRPVAMDTLSALVMQLGKKYQIFIPMVNKVLTKHKVSHQRYDLLLGRILKVDILFVLHVI